MQAPSIPINRWMDKRDVVCIHTHTHNGILAIKRMKSYHSWQEGRSWSTMLNEISLIEKDKNCKISHFCGIWQRKQMNKQNRKRVMDTEKKQGCQKGGAGERKEISEGD